VADLEIRIASRVLNVMACIMHPASVLALLLILRSIIKAIFARIKMLVVLVACENLVLNYGRSRIEEMQYCDAPIVSLAWEVKADFIVELFRL